MTTVEGRAVLSRALAGEGRRSAVTIHRHSDVDELLTDLEAEGWTMARASRLIRLAIAVDRFLRRGSRP